MTVIKCQYIIVFYFIIFFFYYFHRYFSIFIPIYFNFHKGKFPRGINSSSVPPSNGNNGNTGNTVNYGNNGNNGNGNNGNSFEKSNSNNNLANNNTYLKNNNDNNNSYNNNNNYISNNKIDAKQDYQNKDKQIKNKNDEWDDDEEENLDAIMENEMKSINSMKISSSIKSNRSSSPKLAVQSNVPKNISTSSFASEGSMKSNHVRTRTY